MRTFKMTNMSDRTRDTVQYIHVYVILAEYRITRIHKLIPNHTKKCCLVEQ